MEEADTDLQDVLEERGPFTEEESAFSFVQIMNGIVGIHRSGVVHRDIRPDNILVRRGFIKIAGMLLQELRCCAQSLQPSTSLS